MVQIVKKTGEKTKFKLKFDKNGKVKSMFSKKLGIVLIIKDWKQAFYIQKHNRFVNINRKKVKTRYDFVRKKQKTTFFDQKTS